MSDDDDGRHVPQSDLDFQQQNITPTWGRDNTLTPALKSQLTNGYVRKHYRKGQIRVNPVTGDEEEVLLDCVIEEPINHWGKLGTFNPDLRTTNLDKAELEQVREDISLQHACLDAELPKSTVWITNEIATVTDSSQSKGGWKATLMNTFRTEKHEESYTQPEKRDWFGRKK